MSRDPLPRCDWSAAHLGVEHGAAELGDEVLEPAEILPGGEVVQVLLQLVDLPLQVRHLDTELDIIQLDISI